MKQLHVTIGERRVHNDQVILFVRPERQEVRANQRIALAPDRGPQLRFALDAMHSLSETVVIAIQPSHGGVGKVALPRRGFENRAFIELARLGKHLLRHFGRRGIKRGVVHIGSFSSDLFELLDKTYHRSPVRQLKKLLFQGVAQKNPRHSQKNRRGERSEGTIHYIGPARYSIPQPIQWYAKGKERGIGRRRLLRLCLNIL